MNYKVGFAPAATADLEDLFDYIVQNAGERIARAYVEQIYSYCLDFSTFPYRGRARDDLMPGLRLVGFRRRATIAFLVEGANVYILRIFHGGRDIRFPEE